MIKEGVLIKKVRVPVYKTWLWIVISKSVTKSVDMVEDLIDKNILNEADRKSTKALMYAYEHSDGKYKVMLFLKDTVKPGVIAHECNHAINILYNWHGVKRVRSNDEPESYLLEWMVDQTHHTIKRYKKRSSLK